MRAMTFPMCFARRLSMALALAMVFAPSVQAQATYTLGGNSRGYVAVNQQFPGNCGKGTGFETGATKTYAPGSASLDCSGTGWSGQSVMTADARTIRAMSTITANNLQANNLIGLATAFYSDTWTINASGVIPTSVSFTYQFTGFTSSSDVSGANAVHISRLGMGFDAGVTNSTIATAPGEYTVTYDITTGMIGRAIPISYGITVFAQLIGLNSLTPFSGTVTTDFGNTLRMSRVDFFQRQTDGSLLDITGNVNLASASGADYKTPLATVPEPGTFALLGVGALALFMVRRRAIR